MFLHWEEVIFVEAGPRQLVGQNLVTIDFFSPQYASFDFDIEIWQSFYFLPTLCY